MPASYSADVVSSGSRAYRTLNLAAVQFMFERNKNRLNFRPGAETHLSMLWITRRPAEGFQSCVCLDFMYRSWTAAQLQGFPPL